jgi:RNA polymerase sporulation-specific sigma factor
MLGSPGLAKAEITLPEHELLSDQEFLRLITSHRAGDPEAKNIIIQHNLRLVMSIAQRFAGRGELEDLFQIGCLGLMKAVEKFDPSFGVKFSTYAVPLVIGEIKQHLRDEGPIKISRSIKENAVRLQQTRLELGGSIGRDPTLSELETATGLSREEIAVALEAIQPVNSLQDILHDEEGDGLSREHLIGEEGDHFRWLEQYALREVINKLPERLQNQIELRFFQEKTQTEVAGLFGVSQVQVCRLEKEALHQLRHLYLSE